MPESGIKYVLRKDLLSFEEMYRLVRILGEEGVNKVRITGGEPFVRKGMMSFLEEISAIETLTELNITTNGTFTRDKIRAMENLKIGSINLSLDSLDRERFKEITRRDLFDSVMGTYQLLIRSDLRVKVNMVVMQGKNIEDIYPMLELGKNAAVDVRFIEEMPFNGTRGQGNSGYWPMKKILEHIGLVYEFNEIPSAKSSTSVNYRIRGFKGSFGVIAAFSRTFCGTCNRIRITPQGELKTCLYDSASLSIRDLMRTGASDRDLITEIKNALQHKARDGHEAEERHRRTMPISESMATIGG